MAIRNSVPWLRVWTTALLLGAAGAILMYLNVRFVLGSTGDTPWRVYFDAFVFLFLLPSLLVWSLLAVVIRRRSRAFALVLGSVSPWIAFVPATWLYFGELFDVHSYAFFAVGMLFYLPALTLFGAAAGAVIHRVVSRPF